MVLGLCLGSLLSTGCLVAEAPEYGPPRKTTPVINLHKLDPTPFKILVPVLPTTAFRVPVKSEDAGEELVAALFLDSGAESIRDWTFPPHPSSAEHDISFPWQPSPFISKGCHLLKLIVTHRSNYDFFDHTYEQAGEVATVTWWMNFDPDPGADPNTLLACPVPSDAMDDGS